MSSRKKKPESVQRLNDKYRNGGNIQEDRDSTFDTLDKMRQIHGNYYSLESQLRSMGITETGDDTAD